MSGATLSTCKKALSSSRAPRVAVGADDGLEQAALLQPLERVA